VAAGRPPARQHQGPAADGNGRGNDQTGHSSGLSLKFAIVQRTNRIPVLILVRREYIHR
jgi:hypothetical protein